MKRSLQSSIVSSRRHLARSLSTAPTPTSSPSSSAYDDLDSTPEIQIPSPSVYPTKGTNVLEIQTNLSHLTLAHTLAVCKAVERKCGRVVDIQQHRHWDTQQARPSLRLTVLNPVTFPSPLLLSIPTPDLSTSPKMEHYGPSLATVQSALSNTASGKGQGTVGETFNAKVTMGRTMNLMDPKSGFINAPSPSTGRRTNARFGPPDASFAESPRSVSERVTWEELKAQEDQILSTLGAGFKGFYGGFEELSAIFQEPYRARMEELRKREEKGRDAEERRVKEEREVREMEGKVQEVRGDSVTRGDGTSTLPQVRVSPQPTTSTSTSTTTLPSGQSQGPTVTTPSSPSTPKALQETKQTRLARLILSSNLPPPTSSSSDHTPNPARIPRSLIGLEEKQARAAERSRRARMRKMEDEKRREEAGGALGVIGGWFGKKFGG